MTDSITPSVERCRLHAVEASRDPHTSTVLDEMLMLSVALLERHAHGKPLEEVAIWTSPPHPKGSGGVTIAFLVACRS